MQCSIRLIVAICFCFAVLLAVPAEAEKRVALVIGNGAYAKVSKLANPTRDAGAFEALLRAAGFDVVEARNDLGAAAMRRALRDFTDRVSDADVAVVFYAGHGIEVNGTNYLIPVDAALERDIDVEDETVPLERVTQVIERARRLRLVILDACRDNPFTRSMKRTAAGRAIGRGLARVDVMTSDTLIAFAAKHGSTAADGAGANSPYTTALVKHLATPGLDLRLALGRVRDEVLKSTRNTQEPFVYGSLGGAEIALVPTVRPQAAPQAPHSPGEAERAWAVVKDSSNIAVLEAFRLQYGASNALYDRLAMARIEDLTKQQTASETPPSALARLLQVELQRVGCNPGSVDGAWGSKGKAALERFARYAKLGIGTDEPTLAALEAVKSRQGRVCPFECGAGTVEKDGKCVAKSAPYRAPGATKPAAAPKTPRRQEQDDSKSGMCWAVDAGGRTNIIVPCTDSRASGIRAY